MTSISRDSIEDALKRVIDPYLNQDIVSLGFVNLIKEKRNRVVIELVLGYPVAGIQERLREQVQDAVTSVADVKEVTVDISWSVTQNQPKNNMESIPGVKNIIAVASGKGGVGKSATAVNLALALHKEGARVGILDADIYGPSQPQMLGVGAKRPKTHANKFMIPLEAHGIQSISMGYLVTEETPLAWRGPMATGALQQLLMQTRWDKLDYLIIDMPPGTGDIQLTLAQRVPVTGAVIVTTPQDIALLDAKKGIEMFRKVNVPILGVVENMATHICSQCGHEEHIFGQGGGERISSQYQTELLGSLPLDLSIRENTDSGKPSVAADPDSRVSLIYRETARRLAAKLWSGEGLQQQSPEIVMSDD